MEGILSEYVTQKLLSVKLDEPGFRSNAVQILFTLSCGCISMYSHLGPFFALQTSSRMFQKV